MKKKSRLKITNEAQAKVVEICDTNSFKVHFEKYWQELYIYAFNILQSKEVCEDIVQEVFANLLMNTKEQILHPRAYLYKSVKFQILNHIRNDKIHQKHHDLLQFSFSIPNLEDEINFNELNDILVRETQKLPERCREVFEMSRIYCLSNKQIAKKLNISIQTVKNQISKALRQMKKTIKNSYLLIFLFLF